MHLEGWNHVPAGATASFGWDRAPRWVRLLHRSPIIDRFAYPVMVHLGLGRLSVVHAEQFSAAEATARGWVVLPPDYEDPGSVAPLRSPKPESPAR